jgi:hypothetical protein
MNAQVANRLAELIPGVLSVDVDSDDVRQQRTLQVTMQGRQQYSASSLSDGTLRFLALAVLASDPRATGLVCMEEPENGIHPLRIPEMLRLVRSLSDADFQEDDWNDRAAMRQVIINTHSPLAVAELHDDELFVHRDADRSSVQVREQEILQAAASSAGQATPICVIPIRMTEAWLLADPGAIRRAAGNPGGTVQLKLPPIARLETHADPKTLLFDTLACASELGPNRLRRFDRLRARRQVSGFMEDVSVLRQLQSFVHMETQVQRYFEDGGRTE